MKLIQENENLSKSLKVYEEFLKEMSKEYFEPQFKNIEIFNAFGTEQGAFYRTKALGHFTASGFVLSKDRSSLLMTHHIKLGKWLQLGGHADGHPILHEVAYKECIEESGLSSLEFFNYHFKDKDPDPLIFDLDRHFIPARKHEKEHYHYDVRFLLRASEGEEIKISDESLELKWIPLNEIERYNGEESIMRCVKKIQYLLKTH